MWGGGQVCASHPTHHTNVCKISVATLRIYIFVVFHQITFGNPTNFKALFPVVSTEFPAHVLVKR